MWTKNMDEKKLNGVVFLDLRKAFDLVNLDVLMAKLKIYKCDKQTQEWFKSYLFDRKQFVKIKGIISESKPVTHGVPQGSILGPLLFILFMNDLPLHIDSNLDMYADDSEISVSGDTVDELEVKLSSDLCKVSSWCQDDKTKKHLCT